MTKYCKKPDRHIPTLECGFPLPCPWHTVIIDEETGTIVYPENDKSNEKNKQRIRDIREVFFKKK